MSDTIHFDGMPHLSVAEAAARAGLSVSYIRGLLRRGEMKSRGAGEKKYVDERSLNTFLVEREYKREMKRRELSRKRTEEYTQRLSVMDPSPPAREVRSTRINERPVMDWGSLRASLLERTIALTLAIMMTIGTYAFVDQQSARHNLGLMQEGLQDVVDTLASVAETSKMITMDPSRSLAAAASFIPESLANFAKAFNTQINSLVYGAAFPENVPDSGASAAVEIQPYARATSQQPTPDDQQLPLATSASTSTTIINNPVIERVVERTIERVVETRTVASAGGLTEEYLADKLGQLDNKLSSKMFALSSANSTAITQTYSVVSQSNKIDQLTNTDITGPRISGGTLTNAEISGGTISGASISGGAVSATTLSAGETTISDDLTLAGSLFFTTSSSTISATLASSTDALFSNATSTYLFATAATSTSFFATVASSTNLYSQSASLGSLALSGLGIFSSGFLSLASTTIGNGSEDGGLTVFGGATTTGNAYFAGGLGIGIATTTAGAFQTSGNAHIGGNLLVAGDSTVLGASSADTLSIQSSINSDLIPNQNITYDLGSASFFWENIYVGTVVANNLSAASSTIAGTSAATFTINSDNVSSDAEDADLIFFRGNVVPNALISWKSGTQRFELNQATYISNLSGSTTQPTLRLQGVAGQTGNLFEIASSTGTTMFSVDATGATLGNGFLSQASSTVVGDFTATGNATFGGTFTTGTTSLNNLSVTNTSTSTFVGGVSLATLAASGAATLGSTLSVAGDTTLASATSTTFFATTASSTSLFSQSAALGTLSAGSLAIASTLNLTGLATLASGFVSQASSTVVGNFTATGNGIFGGTLDVMGDTTFANATSTTFFASTASSTNLFAQTASVGTLVVQDTATFAANLSLSGTAANIALGGNWLSGDGDDEGITIDASGQVGIGTVPEAGIRVAVGGDARFRGSVMINGNGVDHPILYMDQNAGPTTVQLNTNGDSYLTGGNLGIGTDSPSARLDVQGDAYIGGNFTATGTLTVAGLTSSATSTATYFAASTLGTASAPAFTFAGDVNTGIWSPGADTLALSTGGTERLTISSAGNIGIGTSTPADVLTIERNTSASNALTLINTSAGTAAAAGVRMFNDTSSGLASLRTFGTGYTGVSSWQDSFVINTAAGLSGGIKFQATTGGITLSTTGLEGNDFVVAASGNVGIGTVEPGQTLQVVNATDFQARIGAGSTFNYDIGRNTSDGILYFHGNQSGFTGYSFGGADGTRLTIGTSGNVGIGTTTPSEKLTVNGNMRFGATGAGSGPFVLGTDSNGVFLTEYSGLTPIVTSLIVQKTTGNVGIGTTTPGAKLDVQGLVRGSQGSGTGAGGAGYSFFQFGNSTVATENWHVGSEGDGSLRFYNQGFGAGLERMRITAAGNVGIGTTGPSSALHVSGTGGTTFRLSGGSSSGSPTIYLDDTEAGGTGFHISNGHDGDGKLAIRDVGGNTTLVTITNTGNVGIGTTSPALKLHVSSGTQFDGYLLSNAAGTAVAKLIGSSASNDTGVLQLLNGGTTNISLSANAASYFNGGNVGIGDASPDARLDIEYGTSHELLTLNQTTPASYNVDMHWQDNGSSRWISSVRTASDDDFWFYNVGRASTDLAIDATTGEVTASTGVTSAGAFTTTNTGNPGVWHNAAAGTYRYSRYSSAGVTRWDVGTTDYAESGANAGSDFYFSRWADNGSNIGLAMVIQRSTGNIGIDTNNPDQGRIEVKGGTVCVDTNSDNNATSCIASESDARLKTNITSISASSSLDTILALNPVSFDWRASDPEVLAHYPLISRYASSTHSIGLIAQEVMPVLPEALSMETVGDAEVQYFQLDYTKVIPHLIGAVKEIYAQVTEIASKIAQLLQSDNQQNDKIAALEGRIEQLEALVAGAAGSGGGAGGSPGSSPESGDTATSTPDTTPPVITLSGADPALIEIGSVYSDLGAIVTDDVDQNLGYTVSLNGATSTDPSALVLDTSTSTTHIITYSATDQAGNEGQTTRTVIVGE